MAALLSILRTGSFATEARIRLWSNALVLGFAAGLFALALTAHGLNDYKGRPLGTDFSSFYAAGKIASAGGMPYDQSVLHETQEGLFGGGTGFYAFSYPPIFLLIAVPLSIPKYLVSLLLWEGLTLALYIGAMNQLRKRYLSEQDDTRLFYVLILGFTGTFVNITHGQNGFLSAAIFAFALGARESWTCGLIFGFLTLKPQLGLLTPFALAADRRWRSIAAAAITALALAAVATAAFGPETWRGFLNASAFSKSEILDQGAVGYQKMITVFACARLWGFSPALAYGAQTAASMFVLVATNRFWRSGADIRRKGAVLCIGSLLMTPFALDYDMMILAPAIALIAADGLAHGFRPWEKTALAALWLAPIVTRNFTEATHIPLGLLVMLAAFCLVVRHGLSGDTERKVLAAA